MLNGLDYSKIKKGMSKESVIKTLGHTLGSVGPDSVYVNSMFELLDFNMGVLKPMSSLTTKWLVDNVLNIEYTDIIHIYNIADDYIQYHHYKTRELGGYYYYSRGKVEINPSVRQKNSENTLPDLIKESGIVGLKNCLDKIKSKNSIYLKELEYNLEQINKSISSESLVFYNIVYNNVIWHNTKYSEQHNIEHLHKDIESREWRIHEVSAYSRYLAETIRGYISMESHIYSSIDKIFNAVESLYESKEYTYSNRSI